VRELLRSGALPPPQFSRPEVGQVLADGLREAQSHDGQALSPVEKVKEESRGLGVISRPNSPAGDDHFSRRGLTPQVHGTYQQEDRDQRRRYAARTRRHLTSSMVRCKIPGRSLTGEQYLGDRRSGGPLRHGTLRVTTRQGTSSTACSRAISRRRSAP